MPKHFIRKITPDHQRIRSHPQLQVFGRRLHDPNLWHFNRRSASGAFAVGLFIAYLPLPFQMLYAASLAIVVRVNLPLSVALVWITNPITIPPMFYFSYRLGAWLLRVEAIDLEFQMDLQFMLAEIGEIWWPLMLGSLICGTALAAASYVTIRGLWRWHLVCEVKKRRALRRARAGLSASRSEPETPS
jgi:uncharacterized protein (DUF2062 family)